jgi:hypothetical protein
MQDLNVVGIQQMEDGFDSHDNSEVPVEQSTRYKVSLKPVDPT